MKPFRTPFFCYVLYLLGFGLVAVGGLWLLAVSVELFSAASKGVSDMRVLGFLVGAAAPASLLFSGTLLLSIGRLIEFAASTSHHARRCANALEVMAERGDPDLARLPGPGSFPAARLQRDVPG